jgi:hypothetical protein
VSPVPPTLESKQENEIDSEGNGKDNQLATTTPLETAVNLDPKSSPLVETIPRDSRSSLTQRFRRQLTIPLSNRATGRGKKQHQSEELPILPPQSFNENDVVVIQGDAASSTTGSNRSHGTTTVSSPSISDYSSVSDNHHQQLSQVADAVDTGSYAFSLDGAGTNDDTTGGGWTSSTGSPTSHNHSSNDDETMSGPSAAYDQTIGHADKNDQNVAINDQKHRHSSLSPPPPIASVTLSALASSAVLKDTNTKVVGDRAKNETETNHSKLPSAPLRVEDSDQVLFQHQERMLQRVVYAPAGKLGIIIDTTIEGPIVHKIFPKSPLYGSIFVGDIIIGIDEIDTRAMSANSISDVMVQTANKPRKLTVISEDINMGIKKT